MSVAFLFLCVHLTVFHSFILKLLVRRVWRRDVEFCIPKNIGSATIITVAPDVPPNLFLYIALFIWMICDYRIGYTKFGLTWLMLNLLKLTMWGVNKNLKIQKNPKKTKIKTISRQSILPVYKVINAFDLTMRHLQPWRQTICWANGFMTENNNNEIYKQLLWHANGIGSVGPSEMIDFNRRFRISLRIYSKYFALCSIELAHLVTRFWRLFYSCITQIQ